VQSVREPLKVAASIIPLPVRRQASLPGRGGAVPGVSARGGSEGLLGRRSECAALEALSEAARSGNGGALVVRGVPGVGKTALLDHIVGSSENMRVARAAGSESETELAFAGLHQLCMPVLDRLAGLPGPQRDTLQAAFTARSSEPPDRFMVGLAVLSLLTDLAREQPLLCAVDDAQWLDKASAQTLEFVARRLNGQPVALVVATRESARGFTGVCELTLEGLRDDPARELLSSVLSTPMDPRVRDRIVAETHGNPRTLLDLAKGVTPAQLAGGFGLLDTTAEPGEIDDELARRLSSLPADTRLLLLVAAAEPQGEPTLLWRTAERFGIAIDAASPAAHAGLLTLGARVRFPDTTVRAAVYRSASEADRRAVHEALAAATVSDVDRDRRAWHLAAAATGPDEQVAVELERSANRAQARAGLAAAAAFLERSVALSVDPSRRASRALAAAHAKYRAGAQDSAWAMLAIADADPLDELLRARAELLRARIALDMNGELAAPTLLRAAQRLEKLDVKLARDTYLEALVLTGAGEAAFDDGLLAVARAALAAPPASEPRRLTDLFLTGHALMVVEGYVAGAETLGAALRAFREREIEPEEWMRCLPAAYMTAAVLWDTEAHRALAGSYLELVREAGAVSELPKALDAQVGAHLVAGELAAAHSRAQEAQEAMAVVGTGSPGGNARLLAALCGPGGSPRTDGRAGKQADAGLLERIASTDLGYSAVIDLVAAAVARDERDDAERLVERLVDATSASGTDYAIGLGALARALVTEHDDAEVLFEEAADRFGSAGAALELARCRLLFGEWLQGTRRRLEARRELTAAYDAFAAMGLDALSGRASDDLRALGGRARRRAGDGRSELTAQEAQIARLAGQGLSNPQIGSRLFISPRTVKYHLQKVFAKLDITSRSQLERALLDEQGAALLV
jgi:DNA-binding CsgD family transcriptional regulator